MNLSYAHGVSEAPLIGQTIGDHLDRRAADAPGDSALVSVFEEVRWTYAEFHGEVNRTARALLALGVERGDRVGLWSTNCARWTLLQFATAKVGAILVNINPAYRRKEVEYTLRQSECGYLFHGEGFKETRYADVLAEIPDLGLSPPVCLGDEDSWDAFVKGSNTISAGALEERQAALDFDEVINIQYTSGTTGFPKGAMLTHHNILNNAWFVADKMGLTGEDRLCIPVPFYHCFGMVMGNLACVSHGACMVLPAPHFSPVATLEAVARERCTALHGVPTMFIAQLDHPQFNDFDLSSLRTGIMAGAPCPVEVMNRVIRDMHCSEILIACGMTETSPVCNMTEVDDPIELRVGSIGKVMPHQEQKVIDPETGAILPCGDQGELAYRGYHIMRGYYGQEAETRERIDEQLWLHSGDLAVMDENGYVRMTGRCSDMICRGGENIYPREVEEYLFTHDKIAEAAVFGLPDAYYGEQVAAWIRLVEGASLSEEAVKDFCQGGMMDYKVPQFIRFVDAFPTTVTGKIQKYKMREAMTGQPAPMTTDV